jgi:DNA-binding transcriptional LysR family regulator
MIRDVDISLLRAFTTVVECGSVTAAARALNRTQSAVSLQLKRLEEVLAVDLFVREHKRLTLTATGERLLSDAQRLVALNDQLVQASRHPEVDGEVKLGVPVDIVASYMPPILRRFSRAWPNVKLAIICRNSHELLGMLEDGQIDATLTTDAGPDPRAETLRLDRLVWVGAPSGRAHWESPLPISVGSITCRFRPVALEALGRAGRDWRMVMEVSSHEAVNAAVLADVCVTAQLRDSVDERLVILGRDSQLPELPQFAINLHLPAARSNPAAEELVRAIRLEFETRFGPGGRLAA